jgi:hypothetical protein
MNTPEEFEKVVQAGVSLQQFISSQSQLATLGTPCAVGGTAVALHCHHRYSLDVDHVFPKLSEHFEETLGALEEQTQWLHARSQPGKIILGSWDGIENGLRQMMSSRKKPLETTIIQGLQTLTLEDCLRTKAWMLATRSAIRDFVDVAALSDHIGKKPSIQILNGLNQYYGNKSATSPLQEFVEACMKNPTDWAKVKPEWERYKGISPPYNDLNYIRSACKNLGKNLMSELPGNLGG